MSYNSNNDNINSINSVQKEIDLKLNKTNTLLESINKNIEISNNKLHDLIKLQQENQINQLNYMNNSLRNNTNNIMNELNNNLTNNRNNNFTNRTRLPTYSNTRNQGHSNIRLPTYTNVYRNPLYNIPTTTRRFRNDNSDVEISVSGITTEGSRPPNLTNLLNSMFNFNNVNEPESENISSHRNISNNTELLIYHQESTEAQEEVEVCSICQEDLAENTIIRKIKRCNHKFHQECLDRWLENHLTCPTCRQDITVNDENDEENDEENNSNNNNSSNENRTRGYFPINTTNI